jgi:hypothetical protein
LAMSDTNTASPNIFAGTSQGGLFISIDDGRTWSSANAGLPTANVLALATNGTRVFAGVDPGGVYSSANNGAAWESANSGLSDRIHCLVTLGSNLFAGADDGVYFSSNSGSDWEAENSGMGGPIVRSLALFGFNVFAGADDSGVWVRPLSDFGISAVTPPDASINSLKNYPNPFSQSTAITLSLQESGDAEITILNMLGVEVAHLFSGQLSAGEHSFTWNCVSKPAGGYLCVVRQGGQESEIPLLLSK